MEQTKKNLKTTSIIVLLLAGLSLINIVFELFFGKLNEEMKNAPLPEGSPENIIQIAQIFILVISLLVILPQVYIGIKGIRMAKKPNSSKAHIIWAIILLVITVLGMVSPLLAALQGNDVFANGSEFLSIAVDVMILYEYVKFARAVRAEALA